jgi:hypothetical protein
MSSSPTREWKGRQPSKKEGEQDKEEDNPREKAKEKFKYWIQLGEPLARMSQPLSKAASRQRR